MGSHLYFIIRIMPNYVYQVCDKNNKVLAIYESHNAAKRGLEKLIQHSLFEEDNLWGFWEDCSYEIRKVNKNSPK